MMLTKIRRHENTSKLIKYSYVSFLNIYAYQFYRLFINLQFIRLVIEGGVGPNGKIFSIFWFVEKYVQRILRKLRKFVF